jgi:hypothetical protein
MKNNDIKNHFWIDSVSDKDCFAEIRIMTTSKDAKLAEEILDCISFEVNEKYIVKGYAPVSDGISIYRKIVVKER